MTDQGRAVVHDVASVREKGFDEPEIFVGKDVLELLSSSMYVNPLSVFREYVQNSADAIDDAVSAGLLQSSEDGAIAIKLDHIDRRVVIRDNGVGLSNQEFPTRMLSFGASKKRGTDARGLRGVGRLAALGYVQQLTFRSRANGDRSVLEATWDGRAVKRLLTSTDVAMDLETIVRESATVTRIEPHGYPRHFFEVEFHKPRRIGNDRLLNEKEIEFFLAQVCPCPFSPDFSHGREILEFLAPYGRAGKFYNIRINASDSPIYRPYRDEVRYSDTRTAKLEELKPIEIDGVDGGLAAVGWLIHHDYQGAIPVSQGIRGLRGRVGNIQVGHDRLFSRVFPEERFCSWTIGEIHVLDRRVVPNGRRDEFEIGPHLDNIVTHLRPIGSEVARECRISSQRRNRIKAFRLAADKVDERLDVLRQGAVSKRYAKAIRAEIGALLAEMTQFVDSELLHDEDRLTLRNQRHSIEEAVKTYAEENEGDVLTGLPSGQRVAYREIFDLIYQCSVNRIAAKRLIDRMLARLARS